MKSQTEERKLFSSLVGREYQLAVLLPDSYTASQQQYPVVYLLDGDLTFGVAANLTPRLCHLHQIPEQIVIGIIYGSTSFEELARLRELDFKIPAAQVTPPDSHADLFLAALEQEIMPFIEANYRADPNERTLFGYSSSGFFALYALFHAPELFRRILCGSGDLDVGVPYMLAHDQKLLSRAKTDLVDLYLSVGGLEDNLLPAFDELCAAVQQQNYPGIRLISEIYENEKHGVNGIARTYLAGMQRVFPPGG